MLFHHFTLKDVKRLFQHIGASILFCAAASAQTYEYTPFEISAPAFNGQKISDSMTISGDDSNGSQKAAWYDYQTDLVNVVEQTRNFTPSFTSEISAGGLMVGSFNEFGVQKAFSFDKRSGVFQNIASRISEASVATAVNGRGDIVGAIRTHDGMGFCIGCPIDYLPFSPVDINESRDIIGTARDGSLSSARLMRDGTVINLNGRFGFNAPYSRGTGINDRREGIMEVLLLQGGGYQLRSYFFDSTVTRVTEIGTALPNGVSINANALNNCGEVVGNRNETSTGFFSKGYVWSSSKGLRLLDDLVEPRPGIISVWQNAQSINNKGVILAQNFNGKNYLLLPKVARVKGCPIPTRSN